MISSKVALAIFVTTILLLGLSCSKSDDSGTGPDLESTKQLSVSPQQGVPGSIVEVTGFTFNLDSLVEYTASVGNEITPFRITGDSSFQVAIPYFIDTISNWSEPPVDGAYLEIWRDDELLARSDTKISILALPKATGTTKQIQLVLDTLVTDLQLFFASLPTTNSWEQEYRDSLMTVLRSIISGPDMSLAAILDGSSSLVDGKEVDPELADAIMASSGMLDYWQKYAEAFASSSGRLRGKISSMQSSNLLCSGVGADEDLACRMQLYVLVRDWAETFLHETRTDWEQSVGWLFDAVSIYPPAKVFPPVVLGKLIGAVLQITDIMINNAVLSMLPSRIISFDMTLASTEMGTDEFTDSHFYLIAGNTPRDITVTDVVTAVFAFADLQYPTYAVDIRSIVTDIIQYIVGQLQNIYAYMYTLAPDVFADPNLTNGAWLAFPGMAWAVEIESHDLIELFSFEPEIMEPDEDAFEWWSADCGEAGIQARTRGAGDRSKMVRDWLFCGLCEYSGGAFGEESAATPTHYVTVGQPGGMDIMISGLPEADSADVWVYFPDNNFKYIGSSISLTELESGEYRVAANEVEGSDGTVYVADPESRLIDVTCDSTVTVEIEYTPKFGSIYLVITGLFEGEEGEIPADIRVEGPNNFVLELDETTLIDSLEPGIYDIFAFSVDDPWESQIYVPEPSLVELVVERNNTTAQTIAYKPKYGKLNVQLAWLPSDVDGDVDILGPGGYSNHITKQETIDTLLPGEYIVNASDVIDNAGDTLKPSPYSQAVTVVAGESEVAWIDYSGGHELTVYVTGLPELAEADILISGPDGYSTTVIGDTIIKVPAGKGYVVTANDVTYDMREYTVKPADTTVDMTYKRTVSFKYKTKSVMSLFLGDVRGEDEEDPKAQLIVSAFSSSTTEDTTITDDDYAPPRGVFPEQISLDTCNFESGRLLLDGTYHYQVFAGTDRGTASADITIEILDTAATITINGRLKTTGTSINTNSGSVRATIDLTKLFRIEIYNPNEPGESQAIVRSHGRFEFMNPSNRTRQSLSWWRDTHPCNDAWVNWSYPVLSASAEVADTLQVYQNFPWYGSVVAAGGTRVEATQDLKITMSGDVRPDEPGTEATFYGRIIYFIEESE